MRAHTCTHVHTLAPRPGAARAEAGCRATMPTSLFLPHCPSRTLFLLLCLSHALSPSERRVSAMPG